MADDEAPALNDGATIARVVDTLARCPMPTDLISALASSRVAREPARVQDLRDRAARLAGVNPPLAERVRVIATELECVHACVESAPADGSIATLNLWLDEYWYPWLGLFKQLLLRCVADARRSGDQDRRARLLRVLLTLRTLAQFNERLPWNAPGEMFGAVANQTRIPFDDYLDWLVLRSRRGDIHASSALRLRELLMEARRSSRIVIGEPDPDGNVIITAPSTEDEAESWIARDPAFTRRCIARIRSATDDEDWTSICDELLEAYRRKPVDDELLMYAETALCEVALWEGAPRLTSDALGAYYAVVTGDHCERLPPRVRDTHRYHYVYAVVRNWRRLTEPARIMEAALDVAEGVLMAADPARDSRLIRDTHFAAARICESLGDWQREHFERAIAHYRAGLNVVELDGERTPKARALCDLANVLHRSGLGTRKEVESFYRQALVLGPPDESTWSGVASRLNYALFLYEHLGTIEAKARALALMEEGRRVHADLRPELRDAVHGRELIASILQTTANIRCEDGTESAIQEALDLYEQAFRGLGDDPWFRSFRGTIALNRCFACLDLHDITADRGALVRADMAAREAEGCFADEAGRAEVKLCQAIVALRVGEKAETVMADFEAALAVCRTAGGTVGVLAALASRASLAVSVGTAADLECSIALFQEGHNVARRAGLLDETVWHARGAANALVQAWRLDARAERLQQALGLLDEIVTILQDSLDEDVVIVDGASRHTLLATVVAERAWLRVMLQASFAEILDDVTLAKGRDVNLDLLMESGPGQNVTARGELSQLRRDEWLIRRSALRRGRTDAAMVDEFVALRQHAERRTFTTGATRRSLATASITIDDVRPESGLIVDLTVTRWGSVVALIPAAEHEPGVAYCAPLQLGDWVALRREWIDVYARIKDVPPAETSRLLATLGDQLLAEAITQIRRRGVERVVWVPHVLSGFPLHAAICGSGARAVDASAHHVYALSSTKAPRASLVSTWRGKEVLCIAVDPGGSEALPIACQEVSSVARQLLDAGASVTVIAQSDGRTGRDAIAYRGSELDDRAVCVTPGSLSAWFAEHLGRFDHVLVSSHGVYGEEGGTLAWSGDTVTILDLLATADLKDGATLHLSACETAMRLGAALSLAGGALQLGASVVIGTGWLVREGDALEYSISLYSALVAGASWDQATAQAAQVVRRRVGDEQVHRWGAFLPLVRQ